MAEFQELIKNFEKIRQYMLDFYIYGFKSREDFFYKSTRTYDNERRRVESYLGDFVKWKHSEKGKQVFVSLNCANMPSNPLYAAWKSKSFTKNDILLHFFLLDILREDEKYSIPQLADEIAERYDLVIDIQTIRGKVKEYTDMGLFSAQKEGRALLYSRIKEKQTLSKDTLEALGDATCFFSETAPLGVIGSYILDWKKKENHFFRFKHHFIVHTLEDSILLTLLKALRENRAIEYQNYGKGDTVFSIYAVPMRILLSTHTGRRYVALYNPYKKRFSSARLDNMYNIKIKEVYTAWDTDKEFFQQKLRLSWGVSFLGRSQHKESIFLKLYIDEEKESYVLERLKREGRGGEVLHLRENTFLYSRDVTDTNEMLPWIKTFTGRILELSGTNTMVIEKFYRDMKRFYNLYKE